MQCYEKISNARSSSNERAPYVGQIFGTLEEVENFYRVYAQAVGFQIRIKTSRKHAHSDELCSRLYQCRRAGHPIINMNKFVDDGDSKVRKKRETVGGSKCKAKLYAVHQKKEDNWRVSTLELNHNHELVTPGKVSTLIGTLNKSNIGPSRRIDGRSSSSAGMKNAGFNGKDVPNLVRNFHSDAFDTNDAQFALDYLKKLQSEHASKFICRVKRDDNNRIESILWIDY